MNSAEILICRAIQPIIARGRDIERLRLYVSPESKLTEVDVIETVYGDLKVKVYEYLPKGKAFVMEEPGRTGRGFEWVIR